MQKEQKEINAYVLHYKCVNLYKRRNFITWKRLCQQNSIADVITDPESAYINRQGYRMQKSYTIATPDLETSLISILTIRMGKRRSVRNLLNGFGARQWCAFSAFLAKLHITEVIALLHNWILREIQHGETVTYRYLEDYTDDVYQLSLASRKGGLYVERIRKRQDLKNKVLYYWQEDTTFATLNREKIERSMRDADHFNALQESGQLPEEEKASQQCTTRHGEKRRLVPYVVEKIEQLWDWLVLGHV